MSSRRQEGRVAGLAGIGTGGGVDAGAVVAVLVDLAVVIVEAALGQRLLDHGDEDVGAGLAPAIIDDEGSDDVLAAAREEVGGERPRDLGRPVGEHEAAGDHAAVVVGRGAGVEGELLPDQDRVGSDDEDQRQAARSRAPRRRRRQRRRR